jgi:hypothetical protein
LRSWKDCVSSIFPTNLSSPASSNYMPIGSGRESSRSTPTGTRISKSNSRSRIPATLSEKPCAKRWLTNCASSSRPSWGRRILWIWFPAASTTTAAAVAAVPFKAASLKNEGLTAKIKYDQVMATGAKYVIAPCHNCHSQIEDMGQHYGGEYHVRSPVDHHVFGHGQSRRERTQLSGTGSGKLRSVGGGQRSKDGCPRTAN